MKPEITFYKKWLCKLLFLAAFVKKNQVFCLGFADEQADYAKLEANPR
jgi:hypothetical protein